MWVVDGYYGVIGSNAIYLSTKYTDGFAYRIIYHTGSTSDLITVSTNELFEWYARYSPVRHYPTFVGLKPED